MLTNRFVFLVLSLSLLQNDVSFSINLTCRKSYVIVIVLLISHIHHVNAESITDELDPLLSETECVNGN